MTLRFTIPGKPGTKERPRFDKKTGRAYTPAKTRSYEEQVGWAYAEAHKGKRLNNAVSVHVVAFFPIAKNDSKVVKADKASGRLRPAITPDVDNILKSVLDGLNGVAYADDKQVVTAIIEKYYGDEPRVEVCLTNNESEVNDYEAERN